MLTPLFRFDEALAQQISIDCPPLYCFTFWQIVRVSLHSQVLCVATFICQAIQNGNIEVWRARRFGIQSTPHSEN